MGTVIPFRSRLAYPPAGSVMPPQPPAPAPSVWKPLAVVAGGLLLWELVQQSKRTARRRYARPKY
jgi:hypothetical protein